MTPAKPPIPTQPAADTHPEAPKNRRPSTPASRTGTGSISPGRVIPGLGSPWIAAYLGTALLILILSLHLTQANAGTDLADAGAFVRWALPISETIHNFAMATTMGALLFAIGIVPRAAADATETDRARHTHNPQTVEEYRPFTTVLNLAAASAVLWSLAAIVVLILSYADISGRPVGSSSDYASELISYVTTLDAGKEKGMTVAVAAAVATACFGVRSLLGLFLTFIVSLIGIADMALSGHSSGGQDHMGAVNSLGLHLLGVSIWCGGLIALVFISRGISAADAGTGTVPEKHRGERTVAARRAPMSVAVLRRYSMLALLGFILVFFSGITNAGVRMSTWNDLGTDYGKIIILKLGLTLLLGVIGAAHRLRLIPALEAGKIGATTALWYAIAAELVIMGAASGLGASLSRTPPPVPETLSPDATPVRIITWYDMPPEPNLTNWLTQWRWDWFWVAVLLALATAYLWAFVKVRRGGDTWPMMRAVSWLAGLFVLNYITSGPPAVYSRVLFSVHMFEHMILTMVVPILLVLGAPITLLLKALEPRQDGTRGPREWILRIVHSGWSKVVTHPIFAGVNFAGSIVVVYFTPLFGVMLRYHLGHEFMMIHFTLTGYIFMLVLIGIDPIPHRPEYPMRLIMLIATLGYHAFVGISIMSSKALLEASWFGNLGRTWGLSAIDDQKLGGSLMWGIGEIPTMIVAIAVGFQWAKADKKLAARIDRQADRDGDAELNAYNEMFERLNEEDAQREK